MGKYEGYTEARGRASVKYAKENLERISLNVRKGDKEKYMRLARENGMSLQGFIIYLLNREMNG